ncbi:hypothetical protein LOK49_LG15G00156 [Camellia lanceoleosa]|uniref:Uncharacterized protein n=1 Tax=Camellia lanceoleosa TaxID=1840588 RepID=A0ACC0F4V5_9ERIC|nr:hypothetical protein LOK49_LG15G00156 [Camellia lanceoleosa]
MPRSHARRHRFVSATNLIVRVLPPTLLFLSPLFLLFFFFGFWSEREREKGRTRDSQNKSQNSHSEETNSHNNTLFRSHPLILTTVARKWIHVTALRLNGLLMSFL